MALDKYSSCSAGTNYFFQLLSLLTSAVLFNFQQIH